jgi:predicted permease
MRLVARIRSLFRNLFARNRFEADLDEELRGYLAEVAARDERGGTLQADALRRTRLEEGSVDRIKEEVRDVRSGAGLETLARDVHYAFRSLRRSPTFGLVVFLTLTMAISTNAIMFSLMNAVLWRSLPYPSADRLAIIRVDAGSTTNAGAAPGEILDLRRRSRSFERWAMISGADAHLDYAGEVERLAAASVSDDFLPMFGAEPTLGRNFDERLDDGETLRTAIISDSLWSRRFGRDRGVVGRNVRINNIEVEIVGVLPAGFRLFLPPSSNAAESVDVWFPARIEESRQFRGLTAIGRLRQSATISQANAELQAISTSFLHEYPGAYPGGKLRLRALLLHDELTKDARPALYMLSAAVAFVLLIACVNVANVMLARGTAREREIAIRRAMGAGRVRLIGQLMTENAVLSGLAGLAGVLLAAAGLTVITKLGVSYLPMHSRIRMDASVTAFSLALSLASSLLFGLAPALRLASRGAGSALHSGRSDTAAPQMRKLHRGLLIAEVALSIVPLVCGGLILHTFVKLVRVPIGIDPSGILTARVPISLRKFPAVEQRWSFYRDVIERVGQLPGVEAVAGANPIPFAPLQVTRRIGRADDGSGAALLATQQVATPGYLRISGMSLVQGRDFTADDSVTKAPVAIIDQRIARLLWPKGALGGRLFIESGRDRHEVEIVGVIAPVRVTRIRDESTPHFLVPYHLYPTELSLVMKTNAPPTSLEPAIQRAVDSLSSGRAVFDVRPMDAYVADSIGDIRFTMLVLGVFAGVSLLLASVGLYGTLSYLISRRQREFAIRMAVGSSARGLVAMVIGEGLLLTAIGTAAGLVVALAAARSMRQLLYNVSPLDGATLLAVTGLIAVVAGLATWIPAWRVTRIDPNATLRTE